MALEPGVVLKERYRIVQLLGQGGFGAVYRAWDLQMEGACAVKENLELTPAAQAQFEREAKMLYKLRHPNLPRVFDHLILPGQGQYLVMDYIEGEDLEAALERSEGPMPVEQVLSWISQVSNALSYLHSQDPPIIHRDIKPANIRITPQGQAMLVDFGIAKLYDASKKTTVGARAITQGYSPPEQYGTGTTDARSDIYALGATTYHLLTGILPPSSLDIIAGQPAPAAVQEVNPQVSAQAGAAVQQAMQLNRDLRQASIDEFRQALLTPGGSVSAESLQVLPAAQVAGTMKVSEPVSSALPASSGQAVSKPRPTTGPASAAGGVSTPLAAVRKLPTWAYLAAGAAALLCLVGGAAVLILAPKLARDSGGAAGRATATSAAILPSATAAHAASTNTHGVPTSTHPAPTAALSRTPQPTWTSIAAVPTGEPVVINPYCDAFGESPVTIAANQPVILRWGWLANTEQQVLDHINAVIYILSLDGERVYGGSRSAIQQNDEGLFAVRWERVIGLLSPGEHRFEYEVSWSRKIFDGEDTYGPGGTYETNYSFCVVIVK